MSRSSHSVGDDETGQCYDNDEECKGRLIQNGVRYDYVFVEGEDGKGDRCISPTYLCQDEPNHQACKDYRDEGTEK